MFCASLADVFDPHAPEGARERLWELIGLTPWLRWLLLTKRPGNAVAMLPDGFSAETWPNVWLGISAEDQENYDKRWAILRDIPAAVRFVSYEPALGPLRVGRYPFKNWVPDWMIIGGESGPGARPMDPQWARQVIADCGWWQVPVLLKQWGSYANNPLILDGLSVGEVERLDPKENGKGGALLGGRLWREFPQDLLGGVEGFSWCFPHPSSTPGDAMTQRVRHWHCQCSCRTRHRSPEAKCGNWEASNTRKFVGVSKRTGHIIVWKYPMDCLAPRGRWGC